MFPCSLYLKPLPLIRDAWSASLVTIKWIEVMEVNGPGNWLSSLTQMEGAVFTCALNWLVIGSNWPMDWLEDSQVWRKDLGLSSQPGSSPPKAEASDKTPSSLDLSFLFCRREMLIPILKTQRAAVTTSALRGSYKVWVRSWLSGPNHFRVNNG